ncbi:MAG: response regulator transcription factor [Chloroflexi bacterium]|nr:response regulator transcription factor [Chloroflexota bacterium]
MKPISVMLVDDNPTFLRIAAQFLDTHEEVQVVGAVNCGEDAVLHARSLQPDVVLVDLAMPKINGMRVLRDLRAHFPKTALIALTMHDIKYYRKPVVSAGANELVSKATMTSDLLPTIRRVAEQTRTIVR